MAELKVVKKKNGVARKPPTIYKAVGGSRLSDKEAEVFGTRIKAIQDANGRKAVPADVLADARRRGSPLHPFFEWDDTKAAEAYRETQAAYLLRSIDIVVTKDDGEEVQVRAFHRVVIEGEGEGYVSLERAFSEDNLRQQVVQNALRELVSWQRRYKIYSALTPIFDAIEVVREAIAA